VAEAAQWYNERQVGLGEKFLREVDQAIVRILENPLAFPVILRRHEVRRVLTKRFPYRIFFSLKDDHKGVSQQLLTESPRLWGAIGLDVKSLCLMLGSQLHTTFPAIVRGRGKRQDSLVLTPVRPMSLPNRQLPCRLVCLP
jgi:hypothetical protein